MAFIPQTPKRAHGWRALLPIHPACELIPELTPVERYELGADIKADGLRVPIVVYIDPQEKAWLLDGRSRLDGMERVGIGFKLGPSKFRASKDTLRVWAMSFPSGSSYPMTLPSSSMGQFVLTMRNIDPYAYVLSVNVRRRHLTAEQKRDLIDKLLKLDPSKSDRQVGKAVGVDHKTVAAVRTQGEARGEIPHVSARADTKGRQQASHKASRAEVEEPVAPEAPTSLHVQTVVTRETVDVPFYRHADQPKETRMIAVRSEPYDAEKARIQAKAKAVRWNLIEAARALDSFQIGAIIAVWSDDEWAQVNKGIEAVDRLKAVRDATPNVVKFPGKPD